MKYNHLLVGVDFSPCSEDALKEAIRLATHDQARVTVVHVLDDEVMQYLKSHTVLDEEKTRRDARARLDEFVGFHTGCYGKVEMIVAEGRPFAELLKAAHERSSDVLLLGARGHGDDERRLGTVASRCLRAAPLPVLLTQERNGVPFRRVVCAVDFSPTCKRAVAQAIRVAKLDHAALDFLHVYASPHTYEGSGPGYVMVGLERPEDFVRLMRQNLENFLFQFDEDLKGIEVTRSVVDRLSMGRGIIDHLKEIKGDLLVMGTRGRTGWKRLLLGTTAEHVIHRVPCSILAVKPEDFHYDID